MRIPTIKTFFDEPTNTFSYIVSDTTSGTCAIIDSVLNFDYAAGRTMTDSADDIIAWVQQEQLTVEWILETHVHADHLSAAPYLQRHLGGKTAIGEHITAVQAIFGKVFNAGSEFARDGSQFDHLIKDGDQLHIGALQGSAFHTPGHTPACMTYVFSDAAFVGDTLFMPDYGTARCDFPGGNARTLYRSIKRVLALPPETRLFMCHDYKAPGRDYYLNETTVADELANNIHVHDGVSEDEFVSKRTERDATLGMPRLIIPSVQINMRAGHLPPADANSTAYLKVPINLL